MKLQPLEVGPYDMEWLRHGVPLPMCESCSEQLTRKNLKNLSRAEALTSCDSRPGVLLRDRRSFTAVVHRRREALPSGCQSPGTVTPLGRAPERSSGTQVVIP